MELVYIGPDPRELQGSALPLPEGWPAFDHQESDKAIAEEKLASGMYRAKGHAARGEKSDAGEIIGGRKPDESPA